MFQTLQASFSPLGREDTVRGSFLGWASGAISELETVDMFNPPIFVRLGYGILLDNWATISARGMVCFPLFPEPHCWISGVIRLIGDAGLPTPVNANHTLDPQMNRQTVT